jgi:phage/plasmid-associated DNA primase
VPRNSGLRCWPGGVVELRTGASRPACREDYCTKTTAVAPGADCPRWRAFLARITDGDRELEAFLQRICGYALTGGDRITARFMRQDFFEYTPQFKLLVAGNHKPGLKTPDHAMRWRFNMVPFTVTIPPEERDPDLGGEAKGRMAGDSLVGHRRLPGVAT